MNTSSPRIERIAVVKQKKHIIHPSASSKSLLFYYSKTNKNKAKHTQKNNTLARHQTIDAFDHGMHIKWLCALHYTLFFIRMLFRLNILIFLPILGRKYSCIILKL